MNPSSNRRCGTTRRGFLAGAAAGVAAGLPRGWYGFRNSPPPPEAPSPSPARSTYAMPGPYPGRVVEVRHPHAVTADHRVDASAVRAMMRRGMCDLTGADDPEEAWRALF